MAAVISQRVKADWGSVIEGVSTQHSAKEHRRRFPLTGADQQKIRPRISRMKNQNTKVRFTCLIRIWSFSYLRLSAVICGPKLLWLIADC
jgi:hypothetical protein